MKNKGTKAFIYFPLIKLILLILCLLVKPLDSYPKLSLLQRAILKYM